MDSDMIIPKRKIIQKRIKKKERYARMARIRYRKEKNVPLAFVQPLTDIYESSDPRPSYRFHMDLLAVEENGKLTSDYSLLNKIKICNSVSVFQEKDNLLSLKLQDFDVAKRDSWETIVQEWEKRGVKYWSSWAARLRKFSTAYEDFQKNYRRTMEEGGFDKSLSARKNEFLNKRNKLLDTHSCIELRLKFEKEEFRMHEINVNSRLLATLGYKVEDFTDLVLRDGFPRIHFMQNEGLLHVIGNLMDNFNNIFSKDLELPKQETVVFGPSQALKKTSYSSIVGGFFNKNTPEINLIVMFDKAEPIRDLQISSIYLKDHTPKKVQYDVEKRNFIQKYYWDGESEGSVKNQEVCGIKQLEEGETKEVKLKSPEAAVQGFQSSLKTSQATQNSTSLPLNYLMYPQHTLPAFKTYPNNLLQQFEKSVEMFGEKLLYLKNKY